MAVNGGHAGTKKRPQLGPRKKGILAKGVSAESSVTPKETKKYPGGGALSLAAHLALTA